jgi:hypothetical protein
MKKCIYCYLLILAACGGGGGSPAVIPETCINVPSGVVSWWPGDGNANDIVGSNDGTLQGGAMFSTGGQVGSAFLLDGINDFVDFGTGVGNFGTADFTVDLWVNFDTLAGEQVLIEKYIETFGPSRTGWGITKLISDQLQLYGTGPDTIVTVSPPGGLAANTWYHIAATRQGNTFRLYFNGGEVASATVSLNLDSTASLKIGHRAPPDPSGFFLDGLIDEVEVFNRALSPSEIAAIFNAGSADKCKGATATGITGDQHDNTANAAVTVYAFGSDSHAINPNSNDVIPVAVLGSVNFDATQVDFSTAEFGPGKASPVHDGHVEDVNNDDIFDMLFHFNTEDTGIACEDTKATLSGETFGGDAFTGTDSVKTAGCQ